MDPNACMEKIKITFMDDNWEELGQACGDLRNWLNKDGFCPKITRSQLRVLLICSELFVENQIKGEK